MLKFKKIRATDKEHAHTEVYWDNELLGYYMPNHSPNASVNENWNFERCSNSVQYFWERTKKDLIKTLQKQVNKEYVVLNQHFGIKTILNKN